MYKTQKIYKYSGLKTVDSVKGVAQISYSLLKENDARQVYN